MTDFEFDYHLNFCDQSWIFLASLLSHDPSEISQKTFLIA